MAELIQTPSQSQVTKTVHRTAWNHKNIFHFEECILFGKILKPHSCKYKVIHSMYLANRYILNTTHFPEEKLFLAHYMPINKLSGITQNYKWCPSDIGFPFKSIRVLQMLTNYTWNVSPKYYI